MSDGQKKVLIVDDEEILTWIMSKTLSKDQKRYEILVANECNKALEIMETTPVELVITDIRMPGLSGLDLLGEIREKYPETKVIIMTAYGNPEVQKEANERGCLHYIEKPFKIEDLRGLILDAIKVDKKGFVGQVSDLQLTDIIQLSCLSKMKTALAIFKDDQEGMIYFKDGEIIHAECGKKKGEAALFTILGWEGGDFNTKSGAEPRMRTIDLPWQELLIEAMRRRDEVYAPEGEEEEEESGDLTDTQEFDSPEIDFETGQPLAKERPTKAVSSEVGKAGAAASGSQSVLQDIPKEVIEGPKTLRPRSTKDKAKVLQQMLVEWQNNTEEIQGAAVVTLEGIALAAHVNEGGISGEQLSALTASIYKVGSKGVNVLKKGALQELYMKGVDGTIHLYVIESEAILSVLARADANMGMVHIESREQCKRVAQVLAI